MRACGLCDPPRVPLCLARPHRQNGTVRYGRSAAETAARRGPRLAGRCAEDSRASRGETRHNDVGAVVREIAGKLTDAGIEAVSAHLAALRPAGP